MPVRWSPLAVSEAMDRVEAQVQKTVKPLALAREVALEAAKLPQLPEYMKWKIRSLAESLESTSRHLEYRIKGVRDDLPEEQLAAERGHQADQPALV